MKNLKRLLFALLLISFFEVEAQTSHVPVHKKNINFIMPKFNDSILFESALKDSVNLKSILKYIEEENFLGYYRYNFYVDTSGHIRPAVYYQDRNAAYKTIHQYIIDVFNFYKWEPGYKKKCQTCKVETYLTLSISFEKGKVKSLIKDVETQTKIFYNEIKYSDLPTE